MTRGGGEEELPFSSGSLNIRENWFGGELDEEK